MTGLILLATGVVLFGLVCYAISTALNDEGGTSQEKFLENYTGPIIILEEDITSRRIL